MHSLHEALVDAAHGRFPPADGRVEVFTPMAGDHHAVVEFTGHSVVLTDRASSDLLARGADGFGGASHPDVVHWLAGPGGWIGSHDVVLVARGTGGGSLPGSIELDDHPRVIRSRAHRRGVHVHADAAGVDAGELVWVQVAPGNAASLRAFLSCGFVPIGAETLIRPTTIDSDHAMS